MSNSLRDRLQALVQEMRDRYRRGDWGSATYWADRITALLAEPEPEHTLRDALRRVFELCGAESLASRCEDIYDRDGRTAACRFVEETLGFEAITSALSSPNPVVRRRALYVLSLCEPTMSLQYFADLLQNDPSAVVRHEAAFFLGTLRVPEAVAPLTYAVLTDATELVRHEAAEALGDLGLAEARDVLRKALQDPCGSVRETAAMAISQLDGTAFRRP
jgi:hypothetical protein